jgi:hypothetical protein
MRPRRDRFSYATVDLRDGRSVAGYVNEYTVDEVPAEDRELVLAQAHGVPISLQRTRDEPFHAVRDRYAIIGGRDIVGLTVKHVARDSTLQSPSSRARLFFRRERRPL